MVLLSHLQHVVLLFAPLLFRLFLHLLGEILIHFLLLFSLKFNGLIHWGDLQLRVQRSQGVVFLESPVHSLAYRDIIISLQLFSLVLLFHLLHVVFAIHLVFLLL